MPGTLGEDMKLFSERYGVDFEESTKTWRIVDFKHPEAEKFQNTEEDIPDDHPAMTIINELMFVKLVSEAIRLGVLNPSVAGIGSDLKDINDLKDEISRLTQENQELRTSVTNVQNNAVPQGSEKYMLKRHAMDLIHKMTAAEDLNEIR